MRATRKKILEEKDIETEKLYDKIDSLSFRIEELETEKSDLEYEIVDKNDEIYALQISVRDYEDAVAMIKRALINY